MIRRIEGIHLINFQGHKDTELKFSDNGSVVTLAGESNNGKTSIMRGLLWLVTNRPMGDGFISNWCRNVSESGESSLKRDAVCEVRVQVIDDAGCHHEIVRRKSASENLYIVDGKELAAIGTSVPDEVSSLFSMTDVNFQSQDDKYFLLTDTAGQVSARLNALVHLDSIKDMMDRIGIDRRANAADLRQDEKRKSELVVKLDSYAYLDSLIHDAAMLTGMASSLAGVEANLADLYNISKGCRDLRSRIDSIPNLDAIKDTLEHLKEVMNKLFAKHMQLEELLNGKQNLDFFIDRIHKTIVPKEESIKMLSDCMDRLKCVGGDAAELKKTKSDIAGCLNSLAKKSVTPQEYALFNKLYEIYFTTVNRIDEFNIIKKNIENGISTMDAAIAELEGLAAEMPAVCPICGKPMGECNDKPSR